MVKAINDAGETQSIADFIILEPTPERVIDIVKIVAVENIDGQRVCIFRINSKHKTDFGNRYFKHLVGNFFFLLIFKNLFLFLY